MFDFAYPDVSQVEVVAARPQPADLRSMAYIQSTENTAFDRVTYIVKINLRNKLPATSSGFQLYLDDRYVREYSGWKDGIYFKINHPRLLSEYAGKEIRFSLDGGATFHPTGMRFPNLSGGRPRSFTAAELDVLPTQAEVLK